MFCDFFFFFLNLCDNVFFFFCGQTKMTLLRESKTLQRKISNVEALSLLKESFKRNNKFENDQIIGLQNAFKIYNEIDGMSSNEIINIMFKICLHFKQTDNIKLLWNDIYQRHQIEIKEKKDDVNLSYHLLLSCCINSNNLNIDQCIDILKWMKLTNFKINKHSIKDYSKDITKLLSSCNKISMIESLKSIHSLIDKAVIQKDIFINIELMNCYEKCTNDYKQSLNIFYSINNDLQNVFSVGIILKLLLKYKCYHQLLDIYDKYQLLNDEINSIFAVKACINLNNYDKGIQIISKQNFLDSSNIKIRNVLIDFYAHFGDIKNALNIFNLIDDKIKDNITIANMMKLYVKNEKYKDALKIFETFPHLKDKININLAMKCYGKLGDIDNAQHIFNNINEENQNFASINTMITIYIENGLYENALEIYDKNELIHNHTSHILALKIYLLLQNFEKGQELIENKIIKQYNDNLQVNNTLINFYGECGDIENAIKIFNSMKIRDIATMGAMLEAYFNNKDYKQCMDLFDNIEINYNLKLDDICCSIVLEACARNASLQFGIKLHNKLKNDNNLKWILSQTNIQIKLINMYGKCAMLNECQLIFNDIKSNDLKKYESEIEIWNAMINIYAKNGQSDKAKDIYLMMIPSPNTKTYGLLFNALSHCGDIDEIIDIWYKQINDQHNIKYDKYVITSLIDAMSRCGQLQKAYDIIMSDDFNDHCKFDQKPMFLSLLSGCRIHSNQTVANLVYKEIEQRFNNDIKVMQSAKMLISSIS